MDVSSGGWRSYFVSHVNAELSASPAFGGVMVDDVWNEISDYINWGMFPGVVFKSSTVTGWHASMVGFLDFLKANIVSGKLVVVNTNEYLSADYVSVADGRVDETQVYVNWYNLGRVAELAAYSDFMGHVGAMARDTAAGKVVVAVGGAANLGGSSVLAVSQNVYWCYVAALLGANGDKGYFIYQDSGYASNAYVYESTTDYFPTLVDLGASSAAYYFSQNVYMRDFANGKVLFNPTGNYYTINLGATYKLLDGTSVTSVSLSAYSGLILRYQ